MDERSLQQLDRKRLPLVVRCVGWAALAILVLTAALLVLLPLFVPPRGGSHVVSPGSHERNRRMNERVKEADAMHASGDLEEPKPCT